MSSSTIPNSITTTLQPQQSLPKAYRAPSTSFAQDVTAHLAPQQPTTGLKPYSTPRMTSFRSESSMTASSASFTSSRYTGPYYFPSFLMTDSMPSSPSSFSGTPCRSKIEANESDSKKPRYMRFFGTCSPIKKKKKNKSSQVFLAKLKRKVIDFVLDCFGCNRNQFIEHNSISNLKMPCTCHPSVSRSFSCFSKRAPHLSTRDHFVSVSAFKSGNAPTESRYHKQSNPNFTGKAASPTGPSHAFLLPDYGSMNENNSIIQTAGANVMEKPHTSNPGISYQTPVNPQIRSIPFEQKMGHILPLNTVSRENWRPSRERALRGNLQAPMTGLTKTSVSEARQPNSQTSFGFNSRLYTTPKPIDRKLSTFISCNIGVNRPTNTAFSLEDDFQMFE